MLNLIDDAKLKSDDKIRYHAILSFVKPFQSIPVHISFRFPRIPLTLSSGWPNALSKPQNSSEPIRSVSAFTSSDQRFNTSSVSVNWKWCPKVLHHSSVRARQQSSLQQQSPSLIHFLYSISITSSIVMFTGFNCIPLSTSYTFRDGTSQSSQFMACRESDYTSIVNVIVFRIYKMCMSREGARDRGGKRQNWCSIGGVRTTIYIELIWMLQDQSSND